MGQASARERAQREQRLPACICLCRAMLSSCSAFSWIACPRARRRLRLITDARQKSWQKVTKKLAESDKKSWQKVSTVAAHGKRHPPLLRLAHLVHAVPPPALPLLHQRVEALLVLALRPTPVLSGSVATDI